MEKPAPRINRDRIAGSGPDDREHSMASGSVSMQAWLGIFGAAVISLCAPACLAQTPSSDGGGPCVDVQVGNERVADLDCLNRQLRLHVEQEHAVPAVPAPIDARSSSTAVGTASEAAAEQTMGSAFGKSPQPQRPPPPVFVPPLAKPGAH
jgi:hypothetical protein